MSIPHCKVWWLNTSYDLSSQQHVERFMATREKCDKLAAFGRPVVPLVNNKTALVDLDRVSSSNDSQSHSPSSSNALIGSHPSIVPSVFRSRAKMFDSGMRQFLAAERIAGSRSGSTTRNLAL